MIVEYELLERVGIIRLNRPEARNAVNGAMAAAIEAAVDRLEDDDEAWAGVICANGPAFCAGADLKAIAAGETDLATERGGFAGVVDRTRNKPLIAAVEGPAVAGGTEIILACDLVVAAQSARFDTRFLSIGLHPGGGHTWRLRNITDLQTAKAMVLFKQVLGGEEAAARGAEISLRIAATCTVLSGKAND